MNNLMHHSARFVKRHASTILTCIGGAGVVATSVLAVKATPKALTLLEKAREEKGEDLTKTEAIKIAGPAYIPAVLVGVSTIACIFGANALNKRQQAALISAYALLDSSYKEYRNKVGEIYGEEADMKIKTEIAKDKYDEDLTVEPGNELFYDDFSGRYFETTMENVIHAEYLLNRNLIRDSYVCVNQFYDQLKIEPIPGGDELGWAANEMHERCWSAWIDFHHEKVVMDDGLECYILTMDCMPYADYEDY